MYGLGNRLFFVTKFLPATNTMEGITILEHDHNQNITQKVVANKGVFKNGVWVFYQCITYDFDANGQMRKEPQYEEEAVMAIPESPRDFLNQKQSPDLMTITQLDDYIWRLSKSGAIGITKNLKVDFYQRFTAPLTNLVIILLGIPFAFLMRKRATGMSALGLSIFVGFLYYVLTAVSIALGKSGTIAPILAASFSHITAFSASLYLISKLP
jgi:lipopolysaccharide export system permease protein